MARAYKFFQQAWQESEEAGQPDYNALNNLAVCIANGLGVPNPDIQRALRHLEKAAESGCRGALRNLERMPRRIYLEA
jgi:TPR repeat protein